MAVLTNGERLLGSFNGTTIVIPTAVTTTAPERDGQAWYYIVNVLALFLFLIIVVGPILYVTFCCKKPLHAIKCRRERILLGLRRIFTCYHVRVRFGCREPDADAEDDDSSHGDEGTEQEEDQDVYPPVYEIALTMPRVEDTIPGTPPPMYKNLKVKDTASFAFVNPTFQRDNAQSSFIRHGSTRSSTYSFDSCMTSISNREENVELHRRVLRSRFHGLHRRPSNVSVGTVLLNRSTRGRRHRSSTKTNQDLHAMNESLPTYWEALAKLHGKELYSSAL